MREAEVRGVLEEMFMGECLHHTMFLWNGWMLVWYVKKMVRVSRLISILINIHDTVAEVGISVRLNPT